MNETINRLKREKEEIENGYWKEGNKAGIEWASSAKYKELKKAIIKKHEIIEFYEQFGYIQHDEMNISESIQEYIDEIFAEDPLLNDFVGVEYILGPCLSKEAAKWILGWLDGVEEVWEMVADKL